MPRIGSTWLRPSRAATAAAPATVESIFDGLVDRYEREFTSRAPSVRDRQATSRSRSPLHSQRCSSAVPPADRAIERARRAVVAKHNRLGRQQPALQRGHRLLADRHRPPLRGLHGAGAGLPGAHSYDGRDRSAGTARHLSGGVRSFRGTGARLGRRHRRHHPDRSPASSLGRASDRPRRSRTRRAARRRSRRIQDAKLPAAEDHRPPILRPRASPAAHRAGARIRRAHRPRAPGPLRRDLRPLRGGGADRACVGSARQTTVRAPSRWRWPG